MEIQVRIEEAVVDVGAGIVEHEGSEVPNEHGSDRTLAGAECAECTSTVHRDCALLHNHVSARESACHLEVQRAGAELVQLRDAGGASIGDAGGGDIDGAFTTESHPAMSAGACGAHIHQQSAGDVE